MQMQNAQINMLFKWANNFKFRRQIMVKNNNYVALQSSKVLLQAMRFVMATAAAVVVVLFVFVYIVSKCKSRLIKR